MDWSKAKPEVVHRVVSEGDVYLDGQLKLATSADQRSAVLAGVFTAAATALLAGIIALSAVKDTPLTVRYPIYVGGGAMVLLFLAAAAFCIAAVLPVGFWLPGSEPASWGRDIETGRELDASLLEEAQNLQAKIEDNRAVLRKNARRFVWGAALGISAPLVGALLWGVTSSARWVAG